MVLSKTNLWKELFTWIKKQREKPFRIFSSGAQNNVKTRTRDELQKHKIT
jgi:hypothetical protein